MARNGSGATPTLDSATSGAIAELTSVANGALTTAQGHAETLTTTQTALDDAIAQAQAANERIAALGGDTVDLSGLPGQAAAPRRSRRNSGGSRSPSTSGRTRPRNPYDFPTSICIAMAASRVGTEMNNEAIRTALTSGGFQTTANETSFRTQITQNIGRIMRGETDIPKGAIKQVRRGVYALQTSGKNFVKGCSLNDAVEDESESSD